jgi:hypothetical protein
MPIALHSNALVPRANPLRMPAWPWPFWSRQVDALRWLVRNDVCSTGVHIWRRVFGEWPRCRRLSKKFFREWECWWFSNFSILCGHCWWKLLVCFKTFIYCEQLCNNAVTYPSTPLIYPSALSRMSGQGKAKIDECRIFRQHVPLARFFFIPISIPEATERNLSRNVFLALSCTLPHP